jgi:hypothetical protein
MRTVPAYFSLNGSIDLSTAPMSISPGDALECVNLIPGLNRGYKYIGGYERFDGRKAPSSSEFWELQVNETSGLAIGNTLTGETSGATAIIVDVTTSTRLAISELAGNFQANEIANGVTLLEPELFLGSFDDDEFDQRKHATANYYRSLIEKLPGSGAVRGVFRHLGATYACRNNEAGTACVIYSATDAGWAPLPLKHVLKFNTGLLKIDEGVVITDGTNSAMVLRVLQSDGSWGSQTAEGHLVIGLTAGTFSNGAVLKIGAAPCATASADVEQITLKPGGRFEFDSFNFKGSEDGFRAYCADGINPALEIDQQGVVVPLFSKDENDNPSTIREHNGRLFLGFENGQVHHSVVGEPWNYTVSLGAGQRGLGAAVTGLSSQSSGVLIMTTRRKTYILQGSHNEDWVQDIAAETAGAFPYTLQTISEAFALDDRGIIQLSRTAAFGGFESGSVTRKIQKLIDKLKPLATASTIIRRFNQYWIFFSNGTGLACYPVATVNGMAFRVTQINYGKPVRCICNAEDETGAERIFFGSDDGYIYEAEKGTSFDGEEIEAFVRLPFNHFKSPRVRKRWRKLILETEVEGPVRLKVTPDIDYSSPDVAASTTKELAAYGGGGYWDSDNWDEFAWDAEAVSLPEIPLTGTGTAINFLIHHQSAITRPFTIHGAIIHFDPRRLER